MTIFHEYQLMIVGSLIGFPGYTSEQLQKQCTWLNSMAVFSVDRILHEAENKEYVSCRSSKTGLRYWATKKGRRAYKKYNPD